MKTFLKILKFLAELAIFLGTAFLMLYLTYYFGWLLLPGDQAWGNDISSALTNVFYIKQWYPSMPRWVHLWSGGFPFMRLYPGAPFVLTFFIHHFFSFSVYEAAKLVMFFSIPLAALGVVALGRVLTKNWWVGILAGALMILSPDSWLWITFGGFFAMASAVPFYTWTLVFFSWGMDKKKKSLLILAAVFYGLTFIFHPMAGILAAMTMVILGLGFGVKQYGLKSSWRGLTKTVVIIGLGVLLFGFWIFPFSSREDIGGISLGADQMYLSTFRELAGLDWPFGTYNTTTFFAGSAIVLFVIGSVLVFFRKSILRWAVLACGVALFIMTARVYAQSIVDTFSFFWAMTNVRSALILRTLGPIIGAYGAMSLARPFFWLIEKLVKKLKGNKLWWYLTESLAAAVGLAFFWIVLQNVVILPPKPKETDLELIYSGYGPLRNWLALGRVDGREMTLNLSTGEWSVPIFKDYQTILKELPQIFSLVGGDDTLVDPVAELFVKASAVTSQERIDVAPSLGKLTGSLANYSQVSQIPNYMGSSSNQGMLGWQINCVYYSDLCYSSDIEDLYRWWGNNQIWWGDGMVDVEKRLAVSELLETERVYAGKVFGNDTYFNVSHFKDSTGLASVTNKPAILVIGDNPPNNDVYDIIFRVMPRIGWGYQRVWTVKGKQKIDDYKLKELSQFEVVILHGYQYRNRKRAWRLLEDYVREGGKVLVNTGWKYYSEEWGLENKEIKGEFVELEMPSLFPVQKTTWTSFGQFWPKLSSELSRDYLNGWAELSWEGYDWSIAVAQKEWLKPEARVILSADDQIIMAEQSLGKGKVVWTGFDFFGHLLGRRSSSEEEFLEKVLESLIGEGSFKEEKLGFERVRPELIKIGYSQLVGRNKLMFKETAAENWGALHFDNSRQASQKLSIYKVGPGWKMVFLPDPPVGGGEEVIFSYRRDKIEWLGIITSLLTMIGILLYGLMNIIKKDWDKKLLAKVQKFVAQKSGGLKKSWDDEEH